MIDGPDDMTDGEKYAVAAAHVRIAMNELRRVERMSCLEWQRHERTITELWHAADYCEARRDDLAEAERERVKYSADF